MLDLTLCGARIRGTLSENGDCKLEDGLSLFHEVARLRLDKEKDVAVAQAGSTYGRFGGESD